jgi:hypothetical protein
VDVRKFLARYVAGVDNTYRLLYERRAWGIVSAVDVDFMHRETQIFCKSDEPGAPRFSYSAIMIATVSPGRYSFTWNTDAYATQRIRTRVSGEETWTTHTGGANVSLEHTWSLDGFEPGESYDIAVWGENEDGWSPGWSASASWTVPEAFLNITGVEFTARSDRIDVSYVTDRNAGCRIYGALYVEEPEEILWEEWYENLAEHPTHAHSKAGLVAGTVYAVRIYCQTGGAAAWKPSQSGYYAVRTADENGEGGGLQFIQE